MGTVIIGLTGGVGAGKSTVADLFRQLGASVIDADQLAHDELEDPQIIEKLRSWWGDEVCRQGGGLNRQAIADVVFDDPSQRARLEALIHPRVMRKVEGAIADLKRRNRAEVVVLDVPLLFESGTEDCCDLIVFVAASPDERQRRTCRTRRWSKQEFARREKSQKPLDLKKSRADYVVDNNSGTDELRLNVERLYSKIQDRTS